MDAQTQGAPAPAVATTESQLIPIFPGKIGDVILDVCDGRTLHTFVENGKQFADWIKSRIEQYGFLENQDFASFSPKSEKPKGGRPSTEYHLSIDMAKELSMVENNDKGRMIRRYFIECERRALAAPTFQRPPTIKALPGKLTPDSQDLIKDAIAKRLESVPKNLQGMAARTLWGSLNTKFGTKGMKDGYKNIPNDATAECLSLIARVPLNGEPTTEIAAPASKILLEFKPNGAIVGQIVRPEEFVTSIGTLREILSKDNLAVVSAQEARVLDAIRELPRA